MKIFSVSKPSCRQLRLVDAYHDGLLPPEQAQAFSAHLRDCPACRREFETLRSALRWLSEAPSLTSSPRFRAGLRARLETTRPQWFPDWALWGFVPVAVLLIWAVAQIDFSGSGPTPVSPVMAPVVSGPPAMWVGGPQEVGPLPSGRSRPPAGGGMLLGAESASWRTGGLPPWGASENVADAPNLPWELPGAFPVSPPAMGPREVAVSEEAVRPAEPPQGTSVSRMVVVSAGRGDRASWPTMPPPRPDPVQAPPARGVGYRSPAEVASGDAASDQPEFLLPIERRPAGANGRTVRDGRETARSSGGSTELNPVLVLTTHGSGLDL